MTPLILLALLQATPAPPPERFSVLAPVPDEACVSRPAAAVARRGRADDDTPGPDIVVCGAPLGQQRLPLPDERMPDGATPSNPYMTGTGALAAEGSPCATVQRGCTVGFGPPIAPLAKAAVAAIKSAFARKPDRRGRVSIPLDDAAP